MKGEGTAVKERPILFSGPMVRAILEGRKTQTRRVIADKFLGECVCQAAPSALRTNCIHSGEPGHPYQYPPPVECCPFGKPGDQLWVRETFCILDHDHWADEGKPKDWLYCTNHPRRNACAYSAETDSDGNAIRKEYGYRWRPSIHMPRWASRLSLEVTAVGVEQLQDISAKDILAEGAVDRPHQCEYLGKCPVAAFDGCVYPDLKSLWAAGWDGINRKTHPWKSNPWVWVVEFRKVQ